MAEAEKNEPQGAEVTVDFVRHRNVMLVQADLGPLLVDYFLHVADHRLRHEPAHDALLRQALVAFTLHAAARPRNEHFSWTIGLQVPRLNLFLAGDNEDFIVAGRLFTENVRESPKNVFYSELMPSRGAEKRRSVVNFEGADLFRAAEVLYAGSEQRPARYFDLGEDHAALLQFARHPLSDAPVRRERFPRVLVANQFDARHHAEAAGLPDHRQASQALQFPLEVLAHRPRPLDQACRLRPFCNYALGCGTSTTLGAERVARPWNTASILLPSGSSAKAA